MGALGRPIQRPPFTSRPSGPSICTMRRSPESLDFHGFRGFLRSRLPALFLACCAPSGHEKRASMRSTPFLDKISENSRPSSHRPSPLSLDIPGFSHVVPPCPASSRLSQLSCLSTLLLEPVSQHILHLHPQPLLSLVSSLFCCFSIPYFPTSCQSHGG